MRHWSQLGIRNWRVRPGRTASALAAIALGVGVVVWVTCAYESVRLALEDQVWFWIGRSHLSVESLYGLYGVIPETIREEVRKDPNVAAVTARLKHGMTVIPLAAHSGPAASGADQPSAPTRPQQAGEPKPLTIRGQVFEDAEDSLPGAPSAGRAVIAVGIEPEMESEFRPFNTEDITGRMLTVGDTDVAVMDHELAGSLRLNVGDKFILRNVTTGEAAPVREREGVLTIVGLIDMHRVAKRQKPVVIAPLKTIQDLTGKSSPPSVTRIDMLLRDSAPIPLHQTTKRIQQMMQTKYRRAPASVSSSDAKLRQIRAAERQTQFMLLLISTVALFTAFFVILSTLSMGMVERIGQLGMLRCLGTTRLQIAALVLAEAVPLGVAGIMLGIPVGFGLARMTVWIAPEYIGQFAVSWTGLLLALAGGAGTTLLGALFPMVQAMRVSPLTALRSQAYHPSVVPVVLSAGLGLLLVLGHVFMIRHYGGGGGAVSELFLNPSKPVAAVSLLYAGYALIAPALVLTLGYIVVRVAALVLRVRYQLLSDQVGRAAWRSAAICCGLMVGLSLVVSVVVYSESLARGWDFPKDFPEAFMYMSSPVPRARADQARGSVQGLKNSALVNERLQCRIVGRGLFDFGLTRFVAGDPDEFFKMANLTFVQGDLESARQKLTQGGHVLVTPEFLRAQRVEMGDQITLSAAGRRVPLRIAGVVTSPALDIAANYFNAGEALTMASAFVVLGTFRDLQRSFNMAPEATMFLFNFDLPAEPQAAPPPPLFGEKYPPRLMNADEAARLFLSWRAAMPERTAELNMLESQLREAADGGFKLQWGESPLLKVFRDALLGIDWMQLKTAPARWRSYREELVMRLIAFKAGTAAEHSGSVSVLKEQIDRDLRRATILFTAVPLVALIVAALGVGNLMMANVVSRTRQIAMLRAIGATREQITRLVMGEALVLGLLGCLLGLGLGLHLAYSMNAITLAIWGYEAKWSIPTDLVAAAIGFTMTVCLVAGLVPALRASRSNVIDALQAT